MLEEKTEEAAADEEPVAIGPAHLSKDRRKAIAQDYFVRHGKYDPRGFYEEVAADLDHPARDWFVWDSEAAALAFNVERARAFARGFKFEYSIETVDRGTVSVSVTSVPLFHSPISGRANGGGYTMTNPADSDHMANLCEEAAAALQAWLNRYGGAVKHCGGSTMIFQRQIRLLEKVAEEKAA
jgi:hypothetical protein